MPSFVVFIYLTSCTLNLCIGAYLTLVPMRIGYRGRAIFHTEYSFVEGDYYTFIVFLLTVSPFDALYQNVGGRTTITSTTTFTNITIA